MLIRSFLKCIIQKSQWHLSETLCVSHKDLYKISYSKFARSVQELKYFATITFTAYNFWLKLNFTYQLPSPPPQQIPNLNPPTYTTNITQIHLIKVSIILTTNFKNMQCILKEYDCLWNNWQTD